jgi:acetoin utilization protein AcuB
MLVKNRMTRDPVAVSPDHTLAFALKLAREQRVRHLPVVAGGELVGIVSDRDMRLATPSPYTADDVDRLEFLERTPVAEVMTREVVSVGAADTVEDAARALVRHRIGALPVVDAHNRLLGILTETGALVRHLIGALPVVDAQNRLLGILTETDILHAFVQMLGGSGPSTRLEVELADRPGELARAVHVLGEELHLNIGSLVVPPGPGRAARTAIIHVATIDPREAISALEAAGFRVGWPSLEADLRRPVEV